jgi:hypothetical protein
MDDVVAIAVFLPIDPPVAVKLPDYFHVIIVLLECECR